MRRAGEFVDAGLTLVAARHPLLMAGGRDRRADRRRYRRRTGTES